MNETQSIETFIEQELSSGQYESRDELINDALHEMMVKRQQKLEALRDEIRPAIDAYERGEGEEFDIDDLIAECEAESRLQNGIS